MRLTIMITSSTTKLVMNVMNCERERECCAPVCAAQVRGSSGSRRTRSICMWPWEGVQGDAAVGGVANPFGTCEGGGGRAQR